MKKTIIRSLFMAIIFLGCSYTSVVRTDSAKFMDLQRQVKNKKAKVTLQNSQFYLNAKLTRLAPDSISWMLPNGQVISVPTEEVSEIYFVNRGRGALEGFGLGLLVGVLTGAIIGLPSGGDNALRDLLFPAELKAIIGAIYFGGAGGLIGIPIGAAAGSKSKYQLQEPVKPSTFQKPIAITAENFRLWKESILNLLSVDKKIHQTWEEYAKFHNLNKDKNVWVDSLSESDFQDFVRSGKQLREWLMIRFSK